MDDSIVSWFILAIIGFYGIVKMLQIAIKEEERRHKESEKFWEEWEKEHNER